MTSLEFLDPRLRGPPIAPSQPQPTPNEDDEDEWEYEYSTTETETFYVTLDLSKADFKSQEQLKSHRFTPRGPWPMHKASAAFLDRRDDGANTLQSSAPTSPASSAAEPDDDDDDRPPPSHENQDQDQNQNKETSGAQNGEKVESEDREETKERVQILDLHTANPIISYRGRVFSGTWCENVTTELLITPRVANSTLPILRHLDKDVDLLAASSTRINVTEKQLKPRSKMALESANTDLPTTIIPAADPKATRERNDQRNFLARLIAIKKQKGETDDVTIIARSMQGKRANGRLRGSRSLRRGRWAHAGKSYLTRGVDDRSGRGIRKRGRGRGKWFLLPLEEARDSASATADYADLTMDEEEVFEEENMSLPTPLHWEDLVEGQEEDYGGQLGELMEVDLDDEEQYEDDAESGDDNEYDEGEDEDDGMEDMMDEDDE